MTKWFRSFISCQQKLAFQLAAPYRDLLSLIFGTMLVLSFAPFRIFPFAILSLAAFLGLLLDQSPKRSFWLGFLFGIGLFGAGVYWIYISVHDFGDVPAMGAILLTFALVAFLALYPAITAYFTNRFFSTNQTVVTLFAFPAIWVGIEWIRNWFLTGFPWLLVGYSQTNSPLKGFAPFLSVYGVSLAVALSAGLLVNAVLRYRQKNYYGLYLNLLGIIIIWSLGALVNLYTWTSPQKTPLSVSLVQGNIPQSVKWSPEHLELSLSRYAELTIPLLKKGAIVIWPEAAIPLPLDDAENYINELDAKARANDAHIILGIPIRNENGDGYFNAVVSLGDSKGVYLKRRLVPFGEYVPFSKLMSGAFDFLQIPMSNLLPGDFAQPPIAIDGTKIFVSICYEIAYPGLSRIQDKSIGLLLTVTNDAWFGDSTAQAQHLQMAEMRAIELNRPVLFVTNDGITAIINANGQIEASILPHQTAVLNGSIQPRMGLTPWMMFGMLPIQIILFVMLLSSVLVIRLQNMTEQTDNSQKVLVS